MTVDCCPLFNESFIELSTVAAILLVLIEVYGKPCILNIQMDCIAEFSRYGSLSLEPFHHNMF